MKKIKIKQHALHRFNERFFFETKPSDLERILKNNYRKIKNAPNQQYVRLPINIGSIPCIIVLYKSLANYNVITIYVNEKDQKGKDYIKKHKIKMQHAKTRWYNLKEQ